MTRKLVLIGVVATVAALAGTQFVISALPMNPGPDFKLVSWPVFIRVTIVSIALWVGLGSLFIRKKWGLWVGLLCGLLSPIVGVILVNPIFVFALGQAPLQFGAVGVVTGVLVWLVARSESGWLRDAA